MWKLYHFLFLSTFVYSVHLLGDKHFEDAKLGTVIFIEFYLVLFVIFLTPIAYTILID